MKLRKILSGAAFATTLAFSTIAAGAATAPDAAPEPGDGTYACVGSDHTKYVETVTHPFGNGVTRATDTVDGKIVAEHTVGFNDVSKKWYAVSFYDGHYDVMSSPDAALFGTTWTGTEYDATVQTIVFKKVPPSGYEVDVAGTYQSKPYAISNVCTK